MSPRSTRISEFKVQTRFRYEAITPTGVLERGELHAQGPVNARQALSHRGVLPVSIAPVNGSGRRAQIAAADLAVGLRIMADLLEAGLSVGRMLRTFEELAPKGWRSTVPALQESIKQGDGLAAAFSSGPAEIPPVVIGITQAGEAGQGLHHAIRRAAELMERAAATRAAVRAALAYPFVLAIAGMLALAVLIGVVLPQFAMILADLNQTLPPATQLVLSITTVAQRVSVPLALISAVGIVAWRGWVATERGRHQWAATLLSIPVLGQLRFAMATARVTQTLSALLATGVPIAAGLRYAAAASGDAAIETRVLQMRTRVTEGMSLSAAAKLFEALTPATTRLVRSGEESGKLAEMLEHAAKIEQQQSDRTIQMLLKLLEPVLVFAFAGLVALVAAALLQAIYSVRPGT